MDATTEHHHGQHERVSGLRLAYALFGGILAWLTHLIGQTALNGWVCRTGQLWPMHAITAVTLLAVLHALWVGWRVGHRAGDTQHLDAARFLGSLAVVVNLFNAAMIVAEWAPVVVLHPCTTG